MFLLLTLNLYYGGILKINPNQIVSVSETGCIKTIEENLFFPNKYTEESCTLLTTSNRSFYIKEKVSEF